MRPRAGKRGRVGGALRFRTLASTVAVSAALAGMLGAGALVADERLDRLSLAPDFRSTMQHYAIVDRNDGRVYDLYVNDHALETWQAERRLPDGTVFAIESFAPHPDGARNGDGTLVRGASDHDVHLSMKSTRWEPSDAITTAGLLFGRETQDGTWRMGGFDPRTGLVTEGLDIAECHECHVDRRAEDFILSRGLLDRFARSGEPARISFDCGEREICFGQP